MLIKLPALKNRLNNGQLQVAKELRCGKRIMFLYMCPTGQWQLCLAHCVVLHATNDKLQYMEHGNERTSDQGKCPLGGFSQSE